MDNVKAKEVEGALFAFPQVSFSKKSIEKAEGEGMEVDLFYCLEVLKSTGIVLVPGSGFKQSPGTFHFRITILVLP
jgi:alanine transaminase